MGYLTFHKGSLSSDVNVGYNYMEFHTKSDSYNSTIIKVTQHTAYWSCSSIFFKMN